MTDTLPTSVHRAQLALEKRLDSFEGMFSETNRELALQGERLSHIQNVSFILESIDTRHSDKQPLRRTSQSISLLENLFKTLQPALDSLTSFSHTHSVALQAAQEQQFKIFEVTKESQGVLDKLQAQANNTGTRIRKTRKAKEKQSADVDVERVSPESEEEYPSSHTSSARDSKRLHIETNDIEAAQQPNDACIHATLDGISKTSAGKKKTAMGMGPRPFPSFSGRMSTVTQRARTKTLAAVSHTTKDESIAKLNALSRSLSNHPIRTLPPMSARPVVSTASKANAETMASSGDVGASAHNKPASESREVLMTTITNAPIELPSDATASTMRSFRPEAPQLEVGVQEEPAQQIEKENVPVPSTSSRKQDTARKPDPAVNAVGKTNVQAVKGKSSKKRTSAALDPDHAPKSKKPRNSNSKAKGAAAAMKKLREVKSTSTEANHVTEQPEVNTKDGLNASVANQLQPEFASTTSTVPLSSKRVLLPRSSVEICIPSPEENGDLYADSETEARVGRFLAEMNESVSGFVVREDANANGFEPPSVTVGVPLNFTI